MARPSIGLPAWCIRTASRISKSTVPASRNSLQACSRAEKPCQLISCAHCVARAFCTDAPGSASAARFSPDHPSMLEPREGYNITTMPYTDLAAPSLPQPEALFLGPEPIKDSSDLMHTRALQAIATAAATQLTTPSVSLSLLSGTAELEALCNHLKTASRPVVLSFSSGPPSAATTIAPAGVASAYSGLPVGGAVLPEMQQPLCLTLSWWDSSLQNTDTAISSPPPTTAGLHCAILPLSSASDLVPSNFLNKKLAAAMVALQPLLRAVEDTQEHPLAMATAKPSSTQQAPLILFGSKQLHRILLSTALPPAGQHVTDIKMAAYLLDAHLPTELHYVAQRNGVQALGDLIRGIIDASPQQWLQQHVEPGMVELSAPSTWTVPSFQRYQTPDLNADTSLVPTEPLLRSSALEGVSSYFKSVASQTAKLLARSVRAADHVKYRDTRSAFVQELLQLRKDEAVAVRDAYKADVAAVEWRAQNSEGALEAASTYHAVQHKRALHAAFSKQDQLAARAEEVAGNKVVRYTATLGRAQAKLTEAEGVVEAWAGRADVRLVNGVELSTLAVCAAEAVQLQLLHGVMQARLSSLPDTSYLLKHVELPLQNVLAHIEANGVMVDKPELDKFFEVLTLQVKEAKATCDSLAGTDVSELGFAAMHNLIYQKMREAEPGVTSASSSSSSSSSNSNSSTDAAEVPYVSPYADLPPLLAGQPGALTKEVLKTLSSHSPLAKALLPFRDHTRALKMYCTPLLSFIDPRDGRIHANLNPTGTATGRLSCESPNLQTLPTKGKLASRARAAIVASPGYRLVSADYSQIELRVIAQMSQDEALLDHFKERRDVHYLTALKLFNGADVTGPNRAAAKNVIFGTLYGMGYRALAAQNSVDAELVRQYIQTFRSEYRTACDYMETIQKQALTKGYTETLFGRRSAFQFRDLRAAKLRGQALEDIDLLKCYREWPVADQMLLRSASNHVIQGSAADIQKMAMIAVDKGLHEKDLDARMLMTVHDELLLEVRHSDEDKESMKTAQIVLREGMQHAAGGKMSDAKLIVSVLTGDTWRDISEAKGRTAKAK